MNTIKNWYEVYNLIVWVKEFVWKKKISYKTRGDNILLKVKYLKDRLNDDVNVWEADSVWNFWGSKKCKGSMTPNTKPVET